ncbi:MAG: cytochrome P450 [Egibacteraceae bacterium]
MSSGTQQTRIDAGSDEISRMMTTPEFVQDPYTLYERMRREQPVYRGAQGTWYLTRYTDVEAALRDPRLSSDAERRQRWFRRHANVQISERLSGQGKRLGSSMLSTDPPDHTRLRKLVNKAFLPRRVEALRPRIEAIVADLLDAATASGPSFDLIGALAYPLPITVICELLGVPVAERDRIRQGTQVPFAQPGQQRSQPTAADLERMEQATGELMGYLRDLIRRRRAEPGDDLLSGLVAAKEGGDQLTEDELLRTCFLLLVAGHETTTNLIGNGTLALLRHPAQWRRLQEHPTLIRSAVEELLRYDSPVQRTSVRIAAEAVELGGVTLDEGDAVFPVIGAANRDPERFVAPDRLDVSRPDPRHLSLGAGPHFCLGAPLARLEGQVAIGALVQRLPTLRLDTDTVQWRPNPVLRGLESLPVAS